MQSQPELRYDFQPEPLSRLRRHFIPWLLGTPTFDAQAIAQNIQLRPFAQDPNYRLCYVPKDLRQPMGFSVMASFQKRTTPDSPSDPLLNILAEDHLPVSLMAFMVTMRPNDLPEYFSTSEGLAPYEAKNVYLPMDIAMALASYIGPGHPDVGIPGMVWSFFYNGRAQVEASMKALVASGLMG